MTVSNYVTLTRQSGLLAEMQTIANNIANANTSGFRSENIVFSENIRQTEAGSISMAAARAHSTSFEQGSFSQTNGPFDFAIEGDGFFLVETPEGQKLTRNGVFSTNEAGDLVTMDGYPVLDTGGAPVFFPLGSSDFAVANDGTISAEGQPIGQIGLYLPEDPQTLIRGEGLLFSAPSYVSDSDSVIFQGFVEESNVNPIMEIARMVEVQRAYELGQSFLDQENDRQSRSIETLGK